MEDTYSHDQVGIEWTTSFPQNIVQPKEPGAWLHEKETDTVSTINLQKDTAILHIAPLYSFTSTYNQIQRH